MQQHAGVEFAQRLIQLLRRLLNLFLASQEHKHVADRLEQKNLHDGPQAAAEMVLLRLVSVEYVDREGAALDLDDVRRLDRLYLLEVGLELPNV